MKIGKKQDHCCPFCGLKCLLKSRLEAHMTKHTRERPFYCDKCKRGYSSASNLKGHTQRQHPEEQTEKIAKKYRCSLCPYAAHGKSCLDRHILAHINERSFPCQQPGCEYAAKTSTGLQFHVTHRHKNERKYLCPVPNCGYRGKTIYNLQGHATKHSDSRPFVCDFEGCSYRSKTNYALKEHKLGIHSGVYKQFACTLCNYRTTFPSALRHHKLTHAEEKSVKCLFKGCSYSCKYQDLLRRHVRNCHSETKLKCDVEGCLFSTKNGASLKKHEKNMHSVKAYKCSRCEYRGVNPFSLRRHNAKHKKNDMQRIPCPIKDCSFEAKSQMVLKRHVESHDAKLPCYVEGCGFVGRTSSSWKRHMELHDPTGRPFHCTLCPKHFYTKRNLLSHLLIHTDEKPFKCPACKYGSVWKECAIQHVRKIHPTVLSNCMYDEESNCDHCGVNYGCPVGLAMHRMRLKTGVVVLTRLKLKIST